MMVVLKLKFSVISFLSLPGSTIPILVLASPSPNCSQNSHSNTFRLSYWSPVRLDIFFSFCTIRPTEFDRPWPHVPSCLSKTNIFARSPSSFLGRYPALPSRLPINSFRIKMFIQFTNYEQKPLLRSRNLPKVVMFPLTFKKHLCYRWRSSVLHWGQQDARRVCEAWTADIWCGSRCTVVHLYLRWEFFSTPVEHSLKSYATKG
jgi:hypothetical protein